MLRNDCCFACSLGLKTMHNNHEVEGLIARSQAGEREAFDALAALYRPRLEAVVQRRLGTELRGQVEAPDLVQETLLRAFAAMPRFRWSDEESFYRWIRGVALKVVLEALKRIERNRYIALEFEVSSEEPSPSRLAQRRERSERFERAIEDLSPDHRTALRLVRLEGLSVTAAAERMGRTANAVSHLLIRAVRQLRQRFGDTASLHLLHPGGDVDLPEAPASDEPGRSIVDKDENDG